MTGSSSVSGSHVPRSQTITSPAPYSPAGIDPFEVDVLHRMILGPRSHAAFQRPHRGPAGNGPADEDATDLQAEVVVEPPRAMPLDDEPPFARL